MNAFVLITYLTLGITHIKNYTTHKIHITVFKAKNCEASVDCKAPSCSLLSLCANPALQCHFFNNNEGSRNRRRFKFQRVNVTLSFDISARKWRRQLHARGGI